MIEDEAHMWIERLRSIPIRGGFRVRRPESESELRFVSRIRTYARYLNRDMIWRTEPDGRYTFRLDISEE